MGGAYTPPAAAPPTYPNIPQGTTAAGREALKADNEEAQQAWQTLLHVRRIVFNQAADAIESVYYAEIEDPIEGLNGVEVRDFIDHICGRYCHIDQADLDKNLELFQQGIDPSLPLIIYIRKQEDCQEFAHDGHVDISEATMVTTGTKHALQCGASTDSWKEWNRIPRINQTWAAWKNHWTRSFEEQKQILRITGGGFTANLAAKNDNYELANQIVNSLENLAMAAVQKNKTVEKLIEMNREKDKIIADLTAHLKAEKAIQTKLLYIITQSIPSGKDAAAKAVLGAFGGGNQSSRWDPEGYCWSHGYKVTKNHNSKTCNVRKEGHKEDATRANTMGGSKDNINWRKA